MHLALWISGSRDLNFLAYIVTNLSKSTYPILDSFSIVQYLLHNASYTINKALNKKIPPRLKWYFPYLLFTDKDIVFMKFDPSD